MVKREGSDVKAFIPVSYLPSSKQSLTSRVPLVKTPILSPLCAVMQGCTRLLDIKSLERKLTKMSKATVKMLFRTFADKS